MESSKNPNIHVLLEHISRFIDAAPTHPAGETNWGELQQMHAVASESLLNLRSMTLPPEMAEGDPVCPGQRPKQ